MLETTLGLWLSSVVTFISILYFIPNTETQNFSPWYDNTCTLNTTFEIKYLFKIVPTIFRRTKFIMISLSVHFETQDWGYTEAQMRIDVDYRNRINVADRDAG